MLIDKDASVTDRKNCAGESPFVNRHPKRRPNGIEVRHTSGP
jgi:hypothetical protein